MDGEFCCINCRLNINSLVARGGGYININFGALEKVTASTTEYWSKIQPRHDTVMESFLNVSTISKKPHSMVIEKTGSQGDVYFCSCACLRSWFEDVVKKCEAALLDDSSDIYTGSIKLHRE